MAISRVFHWLFSNPLLRPAVASEQSQPSSTTDVVMLLEQQSRPGRSIGARLFLYILIAALVGLGGMSLLFYQRLEARAMDDIQGRLGTQVAIVERELAEAKRSMQAVSVAVGALHDSQVDDPKPYETVLYQLFQQRSHLTMALDFGQAEGAILPSQETYWPYFSLDRPDSEQPGYLLPAPDQAIRYSDVCEVEPDCLEQSYFQAPVQAGHEIWLPPYQWGGVTMTSITAPIFDQEQKLLGVSGLDIDVTALGEEIVAPEDWRRGYFAILSSGGKLLSYPPNQSLAKQLTHCEQLPVLSKIWGKISEFHRGIVRQAGRYYAFAPVEGTHWTILAVVPQGVVLAPVILITLGSASWAAAILAVAVSLFVRWFNLRLSPIVSECQTILASDLVRTTSLDSQSSSLIPEPAIEDLGSLDELGVLSSAFKRMTQQRQSSIDDLEQRVKERTVELEQARDRANAANQAKSEFLAQMSHELRTPLNGILGYAQILQQSAELSPSQLNGVGIIHQSGQHLLLLINDILDIAKIEARRLELNPEALDFPTFVNEVCQIIAMQAEQKGLVFKQNFEDQLPAEAVLDKTRLRQVLINLLGNAVKFTATGWVELTIRTKPKHQANPLESNDSKMDYEFTFTISDSGIGIPESKLAHIFTPFEQVRHSQLNAEGTGLGLSISQKIVAQMGGDLTVESCLGEGSQFTFMLSLPASTTIAVKRPPADLVQQVTGFEGPRRHILVVDDNPDNRRVIVDFLRPLGFELREANSGADGLAQVEQRCPDLIITDIAMAEIDGLQLIRILREQYSNEQLPILVSSASVFATDQHQSLEAGGNDFLPKPVEFNQLLHQLKHQLSLTWTQGSQIPAKEMEQATGDCPSPDLATLEQLLRLAKSGLLQSIQKELQQLHQQQPELEPFLQQVKPLVDGFKLKQLQNLLAELIAQSKAANS